ncbi:MAG: hypothetical protein OHK0031_15340 [Anaerolineales bacterium]
MEQPAASLNWNAAYKLLSGAILPRPIGWISTVNAAGQPNLAPFSFFNVVCANPPTVLFCPMIRSATGGAKDTLNNARASGEFVVNIVTAALAEVVNRSSVEAPPEINEFDFAGVSPAPSAVVRPPRVAQSPIHLECRVTQIIEISARPGGGSIVIGEVIHFHVADELLLGGDKINLSALQPIGRLAGNLFSRVESTFEMERPAAWNPPASAESPRLILLRRLTARLERLSVDSIWARRASGLRGSLLKALSAAESGSPPADEALDLLIERSFEILSKSAREIPDPEKQLWRHIHGA